MFEDNHSVGWCHLTRWLRFITDSSRRRSHAEVFNVLRAGYTLPILVSTYGRTIPDIQLTGFSSRGSVFLREIEAEIPPPGPRGVADTEDLSLANFGNLCHFFRREFNKLRVGLDTARRYAFRQHYSRKRCGSNQMMFPNELNAPVLRGWHAW